MQDIQLLSKYGIIPEILCVVNSECKTSFTVYNFFKQMGARFITFLPLVEKEPGSATAVSRNSVPALEFGIFSE